MLTLDSGQYLGARQQMLSGDGLIVTITEYRTDQTATALHCHENAHLSYVLKGSMLVGRKRRSGLLQNTERFSFLQAGEEHNTKALQSRGININVEIEPEFMKLFGLANPLASDSLETRLSMINIYRELLYNDEHLFDNIQSCLLNIFGSAERSVIMPSWLGKVKEILHNNKYQAGRLKDIAALAQVHPVTISKSFTKYFGCSLGAYRRKIKLDKALQLMSSSAESLTEIAYASGFADQSHFLRTCKEYTGLLPKQLVKI